VREGQVTEEILCNPKTLLKHTIVKVEIEMTPFVGCCIHPMMRKQPLITPTLKESFAIELEALIDMAISPLAAVWLLIGVVADRYARRAPARSVGQNRHKPYCSVLSLYSMSTQRLKA
jgi:hypothetical protein